VSAIPTTPQRDAALAAFSKRPCSVLRMEIDRCSNTYGLSPCTASGAVGTECYNTYFTCQDKANYTKSTQVMQFVSRGINAPASEALRPYLLNSVSAPVMIDIDEGLAARSVVSLKLADEPDNDSWQDPYWATRPTPAQGLFWTRFLARNKNYYGRTAYLRRGFVAEPWDWGLFLDERYIIDTIGIESSGQVRVVLKDPLKLVDNNTIPLPTSGAIQSELLALVLAGFAAGGGASTVTLPTDAQPIDEYYTGMEVYIYAGVGTGQKRVISSYVGATRVATVSVAWSVTPDTSSAIRVGQLQITLTAGLGTQYTNPATSGKNEYIRIGKEIIRYTAISGDVLSWPDTSYRGQFGSVIEDHDIDESAQLCRAFIDQPIANVVTDLLTESGIDAAMISDDVVNESVIWYGPIFNITACISSPESASKMLAEILKQIDAVMWWSPQVQKVEFKAIMPSIGNVIALNDESGIIQGSMSVKTLDNLRVTQVSANYSLGDATANLGEPRSYLKTDVLVNIDAQSANEYGDVKPFIINSRWFGVQNAVGIMAVLGRKANRRYHAPKLFTFKVDPKDYTSATGSIVFVSSRKHVEVDGSIKPESCFIVSTDDKGTHIDMSARSMNFSSRYAYIAPNGYPDYPSATDEQRLYAFIAGSGGIMSDSSEPYLII